MITIGKNSLFGVILVVSASCFNADKYIKANPDDVIQITSAGASALADGLSAVIVSATINQNAATDRRKVVFKTSLGAFKEGKGDSLEVEADDFKATAQLVSIKVGEATVTASIKGVKANDMPKIIFNRAYPNKIDVSVDSFVIHNLFTSEITIIATLQSSTGGKPSTGTPVSFSVNRTNSTKDPVGTFLNNTNSVPTNDEGQAKIRYSAGEVSFSEYLTITATTKDAANNDLLPATTRVFLSTK